MKFMRRAAKCTWKDYKTNENILSELKINPFVKQIQNYRNKWVQHVYRCTVHLEINVLRSPTDALIY
jgi:hypothetical protein